MDNMNDEFYMSLALDMAERAQGQTGINPVVGCVVVKNGAMIGLGTHLQRGTGHAEVHALNMAAGQAQGRTLRWQGAEFKCCVIKGLRSKSVCCVIVRFD